MNFLRGDAVVRALPILMLLNGCSDSHSAQNSPATPIECVPAALPASPTGFSLQPFCSPKDPGRGNVLFTASGEVLALTGYDFPPASDADAAFVDGWDVHFEHLLTTIDALTLSENPDQQKGTQLGTGKLVARVDGPWAVDLSRSDASYLTGKGGGSELAVPIAALNNQNQDGGRAFATDGTRYAFGFDVVTASESAQNVNLEPDALTQYEQMVQDGCSVLYVGTATFKGDPEVDGCVTEASKTWPEVVNFRLCFKSKVSYLNCQNPDNDPAEAISSAEEHQRGIAFLSGSSVIAQVTLHTDHPFWDSVLHDSPAHFDQYAARAVTVGGSSMVTLEDTQGVDYTAYTDTQGKPVEWRYCVEPPTDVHPKLVGAMRFDPHGVPGSDRDPTAGLRDYYDFATYNQSTQGHLNSDGLCYVKRNYPSPK
ncbi:MAG TPA: hypothetical protein VER96_02580 [Polyangiaceae bacterium]|nr:hypothetical protein [Polyangiaceae bacterium]